MKIYDARDRESLLNCLLDIWEKSVLSSHLFLSDNEIARIKEYVPKALCSVEHLIIAESEIGKPVAFMGTENSRLEMLFLSPDVSIPIISFTALILIFVSENSESAAAYGVYCMSAYSPAILIAAIPKLFRRLSSRTPRHCGSTKAMRDCFAM